MNHLERNPEQSSQMLEHLSFTYQHLVPDVTRELNQVNQHQVLFADYPELRALWDDWSSKNGHKSWQDMHGHRVEQPEDIKRMFAVKREHHKSMETLGEQATKKLRLNIIDNKTYTVYEKEIYGDELRKMDFSHVTYWLDIKILEIEVSLWNRVPMVYHPDIHKSLADLSEDSPYWGIDYHAMLVKHRRTKALTVNELTFYESLEASKMLPTPDQNRRRTARQRTKASLITMGYPKSSVGKLLKEFEELHTILVLNMEPTEVAKEIDLNNRGKV